MRSLETLLLLANLLTLVLLVVPLSGQVRWLRLLAPLALLVAIAQVLVEGPRWEMAAAYALTGLFFLVWLVGNVAPASSLVRRLQTNRLVKGAGVGVAVFGLLISIALPLILPVFRFPAPGGPYGIGTMTYHWVDAARPEIFGTDPDARRELVVQIWYPAMVDPASPRAPYMAEADAVLGAFAHLLQMPEVIFGHFQYVRTNAVASAPVAAGAATYPVLIYLEGANGFRQMGTFQVEELVSRGYIVAALDQPGAAANVVFPDGHQIIVPPIDDLRRMIDSSYMQQDGTPFLNGKPLEGNSVIPYLTQDVAFALDQLAVLNGVDPVLTGRLDLDSVGAFGMSLGGIVVGQACLRDPRLKACLMMDAPMTFDVVAAGLEQPSMWITRDASWMRIERERAGGWPEDQVEAHVSSMRAAFEGLTGPGYFVEVAGMFHSNFMDVPIWLPFASFMGLSGPIDGARGHRIVNAYSAAFFDRHLKGEAATLLDGLAEQYSEVLLEARSPR